MSAFHVKAILIPSVVEMNELLQALDVAVVEKLLLEIGPRSIRAACALGRYHRHIACRHGLHLTVGSWRKLRPTRDPPGTRLVSAPEKFAQANIAICKDVG